jgi:hypothetical protein
MEANPTSSSSSTAQQQNEDQGAVDYEGVDDNAAAAAGSEVPKYPAAAFDLPAAAVQAATLQVQELQQMLAAQRVPRVQVEKVRGAGVVSAGGTQRWPSCCSRC